MHSQSPRSVVFPLGGGIVVGGGGIVVVGGGIVVVGGGVDPEPEKSMLAPSYVES